MAFLSIGFLGTALAQQAEPEPLRQPWWERAKQPLHPDLEKALADYSLKLVPVRREDLSKHMTEMIATLVDKTGLADDQKKQALEAAAEQAVDEAVKPFAKSVTETNRIRLIPEPLPNNKELTAKEVTALAAKIPRWPMNGVGLNRHVLGCTLPEDQPLWEEALKKQLSVEQFTIWDKHMATLRKTKQKEIDDMLDPWIKSAREKAEKTMKREIERITQELRLEDPRVKKLKQASTATIARICRDERARAKEVLNFLTEKRRANHLRKSKVYNTHHLDANPQRDQQWLDALHSTVSPQERIQIAKAKVKAKEQLKVDWLEFLKPSLDAFKQMAKKQMDQEASSLLAAISAPQERAKDMEAPVKGAIERAEKAWTKAALQRIEQEDEETVRSRIEAYKKSTRPYYVSIDEGQWLQNDPLWKKEAMQVFTLEERKTYESAKTDSKSRRIRAMGMVLVAELDKKVAFTTTQREKLLPIAESIIKQRKELFPNNKNIDSHFNFQLQSFYDAAKKVKDDELVAILDTGQIANWKKTLSEGPPKNPHSHRPAPVQPAKKKGKPKGPQRKPEPEALDHVISDYLYKKTKSERKRILTGLLLKANDAGRVAKLSDESIARLETAARGATENEINRMRLTWSKNVREHTRGATIQNIERRLATVDQRYYYNPIRGNQGENEKIWKSALKAEITEKQMAAWKKETDQRSEFANKTVVTSVLAEFDRRYSINQAQWAMLEPKVAKIAKDYGPDIQDVFSYTVWHLQTYSLLIPIAGLPEKELKEMLSKKQWDLWRGARANTYWENIKANHDRRVKRK